MEACAVERAFLGTPDSAPQGAPAFDCPDLHTYGFDPIKDTGESQIFHRRWENYDEDLSRGSLRRGMLNPVDSESWWFPMATYLSAAWQR
jgi:hypothetical protein